MLDKEINQTLQYQVKEFENQKVRDKNKNKRVDSKSSRETD